MIMQGDLNETTTKIIDLFLYMLGGLVGDATPDIEEGAESNLVEYGSPGRITIDEAADLLEDNARLALLYQTHKPNGSLHQLCMVSHPMSGWMYKVNVLADEKALVANVMVTVYGSYDTMKADIQSDREQHRTPAFVAVDEMTDETFEEYFPNELEQLGV